jgi:two-component sensor histidine kinase
LVLPPEKASERAMLNNLSEEVRECLQHAEACARQAAAQTSAKLKEEFLDLERRWLALARSYEFADQLDDFCRRGMPAEKRAM